MPTRSTRHIETLIQSVQFSQSISATVASSQAPSVTAQQILASGVIQPVHTRSLQ